MRNKHLFFPVVFIGYCIILLGFFLYSYTQVDLNLTLSRVSIWQTIQKSFQYIGYYQRPVSTLIFSILIAGLFLLYGVVLYLIAKGQLTKKQILLLILCVTGIGIFAYPAFSYDIFNYLFTAKTVLVYKLNPYVVKPLALSGIDPWLSFLRWTHLVSAYTPLWILFSLFPFMAGFGLFLPSLFLTKAMLAAFFLITVWSIYTIAYSLHPKNALFSCAVFALNPLVIIESVISPHNDIMMMAFACLAWVYAIQGYTYRSYIFLALSTATKLMTGMLYPVAFTGWKRYMALCFMSIALMIGFIRKELLPWYFLWVMPYIALTSDQINLVILSFGCSLGLILRYAPFIYFGDYGQEMKMWREMLTIIPIAGSILFVIFRQFFPKKYHK
jgi:hypothetical protein